MYKGLSGRSFLGKWLKLVVCSQERSSNWWFYLEKVAQVGGPYTLNSYPKERCRRPLTLQASY